ncbi:hypothetical protein IFM89_002994, partial [Coptis chinensis]
ENEEFLLPSTNEFANFASKTTNLYDKEDNESRQTRDTNVQVELVLEVGMEGPTIQECRRKKPNEFTMKLRKIVPEHTCYADPLEHNYMADANIIVEELEDQITLHHKTFKPSDIQKQMFYNFHIEGKYGGQLLSVVSLDTNNGLFPLAMYICKSESTETWGKFLEIISPKLREHPLPLTIISDKQKGLVKAVSYVFDDTRSHRICFRHMYKNFKKLFKGSYLEKMTYFAAKSFKEVDFKKWMDKIGSAKIEEREWLEKENVESWAQSCFYHTSKCEHITNNFSKSFNNWIQEVRDKPVCKLVDKLHLAFMRNIYDRKQKAKKWDDEADNKFHGLVLRVKQTIKTRIKFIRKWIVDLRSKECSCVVWQQSGVPCIHAVAVIYPTRCSWVDFCSPFFTVQAYKQTYVDYIKPMNDMTNWSTEIHVIEGVPQIINPPPHVREKEAVTKKATTKKASAEKSKKGRSNTSKENYGTNGGGGVVDTTDAASSSQSNTPTSMFVVPTQTKAPNIMPHLT